MEINDEDIVTPPPIFLYKNDEKTCSLLLDCDVIYSKSDNLKSCADDIGWTICVANKRDLEILGQIIATN